MATAEAAPADRDRGARDAAPETAQKPVPKTIWMFWHAGLDHAPDLARKSYDTWRLSNPDYAVRFLDLAAVNDLLGTDIEAHFRSATVELGWAGKSDLIRMALLHRYGGYWADATTFCLRPIDQWLDIDRAGTGFFCFRQKDRAAPLPLVAWFLAAAPESRIVAEWLALSIGYLFKDRDTPLRIGKKLKPVGPAKGRDQIAKPGLDALAGAERRGLVPYLWAQYAFNDVARSHSAIWTQVQQLNNDYIRKNDPYHGVRWVNVSKQQYRENGKYEETKNYRERCAWVFDGDELRPGREEQREAFLRPNGWQAVRDSLQISEKHKVFFVHIPKCGGTSIDNSEIFGPPKRKGHAPLDVFKTALGPRIGDFRCLVFVRNPWDRLASAFYYLDAGGSSEKDAFVKQRYLKKYNGSFDLFLEDLASRPRRFFKVISHFRPAVEFFNPSACPVPYHTQKLEDVGDLAPLRRFLRLPDFKLPHDRKGPANPTKGSVFSSRSFDLVRELYAEDIRTFGYDGITLADIRR
ncbi:MAG: hypothetical protein KDK53_17835 [Maritimibacter sp.]|nr:hypothetical protein [Maritimibacter sp.]